MPIYCIGGDAIFYVFIPNATGSPVVSVVAIHSALGEIYSAMNSITRLVYGLISSLLLAAGFVRAADRFDPMTNSLRVSTGHDSLGAAPPCIMPCDIASQES
jgi:hypothetical protein